MTLCVIDVLSLEATSGLWKKPSSDLLGEEAHAAAAGWL